MTMCGPSSRTRSWRGAADCIPGSDTQSGRTGFIDYDHVRDFLNTFPSLAHTDLLETIVDEIVAKCFENDRVEACRVSVLKPDIFGEAEAAGLAVFRTRASWQG
jgi:dihydroneopterin aldolase